MCSWRSPSDSPSVHFYPAGSANKLEPILVPNCSSSQLSSKRYWSNQLGSREWSTSSACTLSPWGYWASEGNHPVEKTLWPFLNIVLGLLLPGTNSTNRTLIAFDPVNSANFSLLMSSAGSSGRASSEETHFTMYFCLKSILQLCRLHKSRIEDVLMSRFTNSLTTITKLFIITAGVAYCYLTPLWSTWSVSRRG